MTLNKNKIEIKIAMAEFESIGEIPKDWFDTWKTHPWYKKNFFQNE